MKKILSLMAIVAIVMVVFTNCSKTKTNNRPQDPVLYTIIAQVENGADYNDIFSRVRATINDPESWDLLTLASANWANGGFTISIPAVVNSQYLNFFYDEDVPFDFSNDSVKVAFISYFEGFSSTSDWNYNDWVDDFIHGKIVFDLVSLSISMTEVQYIYADGAVTVTGSADNEGVQMTANISLNAGWNIMYTTMRLSLDDFSMSVELTTTPVADCKWYTESDFEDLFFLKLSENGNDNLAKRDLQDFRTKAKKAFFGKQPINKSK
ncbi:MAG: hypothetical protein FWE63_07960 [Bacteroidales bacterium]|nr:hypothetical protein [Bacteroidales bacterium]